MKCKHSWLILTASLICALAVAAEDRPDVKIVSTESFKPVIPAGYFVLKCHGGEVALLVPEGWDTQELSKNSKTKECVASPDFSKDQDSWIGVQIVLLIPPDRPGAQTPEQFAEKNIAGARRQASEFQEWSHEDKRFRYKTIQADIGPTTAIAIWGISKSTGSGIGIILSAPASDWSETRKRGEVILRNIAVASSN